MKGRVLLTLPALLIAIALLSTSNGAAIVWGTGGEGPATGGAVDQDGYYLAGTRAFGPGLDLSNGALIQLWKAVGSVDDPRGVPDAYSDPNWAIDDVLLDEVHAGYGVVPPGGPAMGEWSRTVEVDIAPGDVIYPRAYNVPKPEIEGLPPWELETGIRSTGGSIITHTVVQVTNPERYYFDNLQTSGSLEPPPRTLTMGVSPAEAGTAIPPVGEHVYEDGTVVEIEAEPHVPRAWFFDHWEGPVDGPAIQNANQVTMDADKAVTAVFVDYGVTRAERKYLDGSGASQVYVPGTDYEMPIRIEYVGTLTEMEVQDTAPAGWTFVSVGGPNPPDVTPNVGDTGTFTFGWDTSGTSPVSFSYKVRVPAAEEGDKEFSDGKVLYRSEVGRFQQVITPDPFRVQLDTDGDGLSDEKEATIGTDPLLGDTDGDGWSDGPLDPDGDGPIVAGPDFYPLDPERWLEPTTVTVQVDPAEVVLGEAVCIYGCLTDSSGEGIADREVRIEVSPPEATAEVFTRTTNVKGDYAFYFTASFAAEGWSATASWPGDRTHEGATSAPAFFNVLPADTKVSIASSAKVVFSSGTVDISGQLEATTQLPPESTALDGQEIYLHRLGPGGETPVVLSATSDPDGGYGFAGVALPEVGVWTMWVEFNGSPNLNPSSSEEIHVEVKVLAGYAILVSGRGEDDDRLESHNRTCDTVYRKLQQREFEPESILYFRFGIPDDTSIAVDGEPSVEGIQHAITTWAEERMAMAPGPLFLVFIGSGKSSQFYLSGEQESVAPQVLDGWITSLETALVGSPAEGEPITFIYGAPYSGSFIQSLSRKENPRVIITSCDPNEAPVTGPQEDGVVRQGDFFVVQLFENLARGRDLMRSFEKATDATRTYTLNKDGNGLTKGFVYPDLSAQHPLLDDNGNEFGSFGFTSEQAGDDGSLSAGIFLGYGEPEPEAQIIEAPAKQLISAGENPNLWAKVSDRDRVEALWMVIKPPFFSMGMLGADLTSHRDVEAASLPLFDPDEDGTYSVTDYPEFAEEGTYRVLFFVKDKDSGQLGGIWETKVVVVDPVAPDPGEFSMVSPEDGATVGLAVLLSWGESQKERPHDEILYRVQIAADTSFENVVFEKSEIEGTTLLVGGEAGLFDRTTYYWRVMAESFFGKVRFALRPEMKSTDIGEAPAGETHYDRPTNSYTVLGSGLGYFESEDQFRFVHTSAGGSFEVSARLDSLEGIDTPAVAGIMVRRSTDADSPYAMVGINVEGGVVSAFRGVPGCSAWTGEYGSASLPEYLKLVCLRSLADDSVEITPYFSPDNQTWHPGPAMNLVLPEDVQVGICVASGDEARLVEAVVREFTISPLAAGEEPAAGDRSLFPLGSPVETLGTDYSTFTTDAGAGSPPYNVLTVLVYNQNDPSQSPPGTTIDISPFVGTIYNWMYSNFVPTGTYSIDVSAATFSPEHRETEVTSTSAATEVFLLAPNPNSVFGSVTSANTSSNIRGASVQLEVTSGIYTGITYDAVTDTDGKFTFTDIHSAVNYDITVSKTYYNDYQAVFTLGTDEAKDLGTISIGFTDDDEDDLPDDFEQIIVDADPGDAISSIADVLPDDDFDGDSQTNRDEYLAATDPTSDSSCLRIISIAPNTPSGFTIIWTSVTEMLYRVYYSDSVGGWSLGASDIAASGTGENCWTDGDTSGTIPPPGEATVRFYKIEAY